MTSAGDRALKIWSVGPDGGLELESAHEPGFGLSRMIFGAGDDIYGHGGGLLVGCTIDGTSLVVRKDRWVEAPSRREEPRGREDV